VGDTLDERQRRGAQAGPKEGRRPRSQLNQVGLSPARKHVVSTASRDAHRRGVGRERQFTNCCHRQDGKAGDEGARRRCRSRIDGGPSIRVYHEPGGGARGGARDVSGGGTALGPVSRDHFDDFFGPVSDVHDEGEVSTPSASSRTVRASGKQYTALTLDFAAYSPPCPGGEHARAERAKNIERHRIGAVPQVRQLTEGSRPVNRAKPKEAIWWATGDHLRRVKDLQCAGLVGVAVFARRPRHDYTSRVTPRPPEPTPPV
jgi:hypothetical protein